LTHLSQKLFAGHYTSLRVFGRFDHHHDFHCEISFAFVISVASDRTGSKYDPTKVRV
jgi:hypothetical protein